MKDRSKTKEQLIEELEQMCQRVIELEEVATKRKQTQEELIRLSNAVRMSRDSIVISDLDAKIVDVNQATLGMYGTDDKKDLIGKSSFDLIAPEDRKKAVAGMKEVLGKGYINDREYYVITKDGSRIPVEMSVALMQDAAGEPIGFVAISRDITERVRTERLLQALDHAAIAMGKTLTPEEIFTAVAEELKKLGFSCTVLLTDESQKRLLPKYFHYETGAIKTAEKLVGLKADSFSIPLEAVDVYRKVIQEKKTVFVENVEEVVRQLLPGPAKRLASQIAKMLKVSKSIDAPLIVDDEVIGLLLVQSDDLTEEDIPSITAFTHQMAAAWRKAQLLQDLQRSLTERERVEEASKQRAAQLETISEVSRTASSLLDLDRLLSYVVKDVQRRFGYYHVDILLVDHDQGYVNLLASSNPRVQKRRERFRFKVGKEGMIGWVAQSGKTLLANDVLKQPHFVPHEMLPETKSELTVPLKVKDQTVGVLDVQSHVLDAFSDDDVFVLETLGNQVAILIENARLFQETQRRVEEMAALREVSLATLSTLERDQIFEIMLDQLGKVVAYDNAAIKILTPDGREKMIAGRGPITREQIMWDGFDTKDNKLVQEMRETRQPVVVHDTHTDERFAKVGNWERFHSWVTAPLFIRDNLAGFLVVEKASSGFYDERAVQLLETFAHSAAIALENAELYDATKRRAEEVSVLHRIAFLTTSTLDLNEVLKLIYEQINHLMKPDTCYIALYDEQQKRITFEIFVEKGKLFDRFSKKAGEMGLSGWIIQEKKPLLIRNMAKKTPPVVPGVVGEPIPPELCYLGVPIVKKDTVIGVISVQNFQPDTYDEKDQQFLTAIADQAAVAIENARLFGELQQRAKEMAVLNELSQALTARLSVEEVLAEAYHQASRLVDTTNFYIGLYDEEKDEITFPFNVSESEIDNQITVMSASQGITGYIIRNRTSVLLGENGLAWQKEKGIETLGQEAPSWLGVPLLVGDRVLGVMVVQSYTTPNLYDEHDRDLLTAIASPTAIALQNSYLFEQTEEALAALRLSEQRFALAVQGANDGIWDWDIQTDLLYWGPRMKALLGYADDELDVTFATFESILHPDDKRQTKAAIDARLKDGGSYNIEHRLRTKSGGYRWFRSRGQMILDEDGNPVRMIGSTTDITGYKQAEEEIRKLNRYLESVIDNANVWLDVTDEEANIILWNKAAEIISGYSREEVMNHDKIWEWLYPDDKYRKVIIDRAVATIEKGEVRHNLATTIRCKDGQAKIMSWDTRGLIDEKGNPIGLIAVGRDITEQKQSAEKLRKTLEGTIQAVGLTVEIRDPYTAGHQRRVTQLACALAKEMGLPEEQVEGIRVAGLMHDIGKLSIPAEILSKPTELTDLEFRLVQRHPQVAYDILKTIAFPWPVAQIVLQHHERMDGSGYPQGLKGEQIILEARILAAADVVEAMASHRPYRPTLGIDQALEEIKLKFPGCG